jgi:hypothetical protein
MFQLWLDVTSCVDCVLLLLLQLKDVTEQIGHLTEAITAASAAVGE